MASPDHSRHDPDKREPTEVRQNWVNRRRDKIVAEIARNRRGEYTVPTWVLVAVLILIVGGWLALVLMS